MTGGRSDASATGRRAGTAVAGVALGDPSQRRGGLDAEIKAYQELKSNIHRKLIDRMDLSTVSELSPDQLSGIIKAVVETPDHRRRDPLDAGGTGTAGPRDPARDAGPGPAGAAAPGPGDLRHHGQRFGPGLHREAREAPQDEGRLQGRRPPDDDHRADRLEGRPAGRRILPPRRRPPAGRVPRQRHHSAAGAGRSGAFHPAVRRRPPEDGEPARLQVR